MTKEQILEELKSLINEGFKNADPSQKAEIEKIKNAAKEEINLDTPLATIGWDSLQMTWLIVNLENRLKIDASTISMFDLFTVGDLVEEIQLLLEEETV
jgi:acyl carrier protein